MIKRRAIGLILGGTIALPALYSANSHLVQL